MMMSCPPDKDTNPASYAFQLREYLQSLAEVEREKNHETAHLVGFDSGSFSTAVDLGECAFDVVTDDQGREMQIGWEAKPNSLYEIVTCTHGDTEHIYYTRSFRENECSEIRRDIDGTEGMTLYRDNMTMTVNAALVDKGGSCDVNMPGNEMYELSLDASQELCALAKRERGQWLRRLKSDRTNEEALVEQANRVASLMQLRVA